ncbi:MAG: hypothetical protein EZS28_035650 [Streblomastix strix]|uniref:Uncharacterized protein n=1 Tax=Streblomastix strix TaxID=222440 RepID=A0A5J4UF99_9EUKA|nr:MAG: hypothetical protein EZS28_035650 [Streblomastix strix]
MNHLEHWKGKHCIPELVAKLDSNDESVKLKALKKTMKKIGKARMECCRAKQFSGLLDKINLLMIDLKSKKAEHAIAILELLSTKITVMQDEEVDKLINIFKAKELDTIMKLTFLNKATPEPLKESLAYSISALGVIKYTYESCFESVIEFLLEKLKAMEELLGKQPYNKELDPKRSKYGFRTLATILNALCIFTFEDYAFNQKIMNYGGIEIGLRYLNHKSTKIRVIASTLFGLSCFKNIGFHFRKINNCLDILSINIPPPLLITVSSTQSDHNSPQMHLQHLHTGWTKPMLLLK